jgi:peptidyl-prolyl cis-trans isomerase C
VTPRTFAIGRFACAAFVALLLISGVAGSASPAKRRARPASSSRALPESLQVLVRIGGEAITRRDVEKRIASLPEQFRANYSTPEGRQQLLERMVEERVWLAMALKYGVADRPQVKQQLEQQRRDLIIRTYVTEVMGANSAPSDSDAKAYYDAHQADYQIPATVTVRHIQTKTEAEAKRVRQWTKGKQDWAALAKRFSTDSLTRSSGGSLGSVTREGVFPSLGSQPALAESAFALPEGGVGGPYKTERGWHILKVDAVKPESVRPFDQVRSVILRQLSNQRSQEFYKSKLSEAREELGVRPDSVTIKSFVSQKKSARDLFNEAQAIGPPEARIKAYTKLLEDYPDSDVSPQAQFMVGFIYSEEIKNYDQAERAFRDLLARYPKAELAASAQWMIDHMRTEEAPAFVDLNTDSTRAAPDTSREDAGLRKGPVRRP